jgi:VanZ family protein
MKQLLRHYPISIIIAIGIIYLSCFKPPQNSLEEIPNMDKVVHFSMYCCFSLLIWLEYLRSHHFQKSTFTWHSWLLGLIVPIFLGCSMELAQRFLTDYRAFEWGDIAANTSGAVFATICTAIYIRYRIKKGMKGK